MITEIDHVQLAMPIGGEDAARKFYHDVPGDSETGSNSFLNNRRP